MTLGVHALVRPGTARTAQRADRPGDCHRVSCTAMSPPLTPHLRPSWFPRGDDPALPGTLRSRSEGRLLLRLRQTLSPAHRSPAPYRINGAQDHLSSRQALSVYGAIIRPDRMPFIALSNLMPARARKRSATSRAASISCLAGGRRHYGADLIGNVHLVPPRVAVVEAGRFRPGLATPCLHFAVVALRRLYS